MTEIVAVGPATAEDVTVMADVCARATRQAYAGLVTSDYLDRVISHWYAPARLLEEITPTADWFGYVVARIGDRVVGVAGAGRTPDPTTCELYALYVAPEWQHRGAGRALVADAMQRARDAGAARLQVAVMPGNVEAERFYRSCGFMDAGTRPIYAPHGQEGGPAVAHVLIADLA